MALANDRNTPYRDRDLIVVPVAAGAVIYAGALVAANATGFATPGATAATLTPLGRAEEQVDNSAGADGDMTITIRRARPFKWKNSGADPVTQASQGKAVYIVDDETVAATSDTGARSVAGVMVGLDSDGVWVE